MAHRMGPRGLGFFVGLAGIFAVAACGLIPALGVAVRSQLSQEETREVGRAIEIWNEATGLPLFRLDASGSVFVYKVEPFVEDWKVAEARNYYVSGHIAYSVNVSPETRLNMFLHELGHILGLKHNDSPDSVMQPYINSTILRPSPEDVRNARRARLIFF